MDPVATTNAVVEGLTKSNSGVVWLLVCTNILTIMALVYTITLFLKKVKEIKDIYIEQINGNNKLSESIDAMNKNLTANFQNQNEYLKDIKRDVVK